MEPEAQRPKQYQSTERARKSYLTQPGTQSINAK